MSSRLPWIAAVLLTTIPHGEATFYYNVTANGTRCVFPFLYKGVYYHTCTTENGSKPWCSTTDNYTRDERWGECLDYDVCQTHSTLSDPWRNIGFNFTSLPGGPKNDRNLTAGWYRFSGIGGDHMVSFCPSSKSTPTLSSIISNSSGSAQFQLYTCDAVHWSTSVECAQQNINTLDCGGGLILYYLVPTNGMYGSRHSLCSNLSCGKHAKCGLPYGSCTCNAGLSIPDGFLPTENLYGCTDLNIKQNVECKADFTARCAEEVLNQFQNSTAKVISLNVVLKYLSQVQMSSNVLRTSSTDQMKLVSYGNSILNNTEKLLNMLMINAPSVNYVANMSLKTLEVRVVMIGRDATSKTTQLQTSDASLDIDLAGISKNNNGSAGVAFASYSNISDMLSPSLFRSNSSTNKTMMSTVVSATLFNTTNSQLTKPVNFTLQHVTKRNLNGNLFCVYWKNTEWVVDGCQTIRTIPNGTYTVCSCDHLSTFGLIMETVYFTSESGPELLEEILNGTFTELPQSVVTDTLAKLMNDSVIKGASNHNSVLNVNKILAGFEKLVSALVTYTATYNFIPIILPNLEVQVFMIGPNASLTKIPLLNTSTANLDIDLIGIAKKNNGSAAVSFMSYTNVTNLLEPSLFVTAENTEKTMMSTVVSATLMKTTNTKLSTAVNFTLKHTAKFNPDGNLSCVYWNKTKWIVDGCELLQSNSSHSVCSCVHLSTFALIMQTKKTEDKVLQDDPILELFTTVAVAVGLVFLSLALLTFVLCRRNPRVNNTARMNLCISLLLAHLLFLLTQSFLQYIQPITLVCAVLAGVLHFFFLSAFVWMFIEAVLLFNSVKNISKISSKQKEVLTWKYMIVIGYVIPLSVVGVSVGLFPDGYGSEQCWIKTDRNFVWSFLGPVCFILTINMILFISIILTLRSALAGRNTEISQIKQTKVLVFKTLIQIVILGGPWILGFFTQGSKVLEIVFLFLNSQQGTFIFLVHCVFNQEVRQQYRTWMDACLPFYKQTLLINTENRIPLHAHSN